MSTNGDGVMSNPMKKFKEQTDVADDNVLSFAKLSEHAFPPVRGSEQAAGLDLKRLVQTIFHLKKLSVEEGETSGFEIVSSRGTKRFPGVAVRVYGILCAPLGWEFRRGFFPPMY